MSVKKLVGPRKWQMNRIWASSCGSADLSELDWTNWFQDHFQGTYVHVRKLPSDEGETWHRVIPKTPKGFICNRVAVHNGEPHWLFDPADEATP